MPLELTDVGYTYAEGTSWAQRALSGVSLAVEPGMLIVVAGSTGSGKSTLLRLAGGLLQPARGLVTLDDAPLQPSHLGRDIGIVFQDPESQLFAETVLADVAFGPLNLGLSQEESLEAARDSLEAVGLDAAEFGERSPFTLSGGEARKVAIAGVLAMRPRFILADEPTAGLDAAGRESVRGILRSVRSSAGVVAVTHDPEEFLSEADRVVFLSAGRVVFSGTTDDLLHDPSPFFEAGLLPPDVVRTQLLARDAGCRLPQLTLDPETAAEQLHAAALLLP